MTSTENEVPLYVLAGRSLYDAEADRSSWPGLGPTPAQIEASIETYENLIPMLLQGACEEVAEVLGIELPPGYATASLVKMLRILDGLTVPHGTGPLPASPATTLSDLELSDRSAQPSETGATFSPADRVVWLERLQLLAQYLDGTGTKVYEDRNRQSEIDWYHEGIAG